MTDKVKNNIVFTEGRYKQGYKTKEEALASIKYTNKELKDRKLKRVYFDPVQQLWFRTSHSGYEKLGMSKFQFDFLKTKVFKTNSARVEYIKSRINYFRSFSLMQENEKVATGQEIWYLLQKTDPRNRITKTWNDMRSDFEEVLKQVWPDQEYWEKYAIYKENEKNKSADLVESYKNLPLVLKIIFKKVED